MRATASVAFAPLRCARMTTAQADAELSASGRILVVDDDPTVSDVVGRYLSVRATTSRWSVTAWPRSSGLSSNAPDLVVLDIMLPGLDGLAVCRRLHQRGSVPVILLTALGAETDRIMGLEVGADDYVTKPFSPRELVLRVASVLRRSRLSSAPPTNNATVLLDGPLRVDVIAHDVMYDGGHCRSPCASSICLHIS